MNERIKQLLGQAYDETVPETWTTLSSLQQGRIYEKFAELIVRECIEWCNAHATINGTAQQVRDSIREHFGVEA